MKKAIAVLFVVVLLFATAVSADAVDYNNRNDVLAVFSAKPEFESGSITIKLSDIRGENDFRFSANPDSGFIYATDVRHRIFLKELDDNVEINEEALIFKRVEEIDLYLSYRFKAYIYMSSREAAFELQPFSAGEAAAAVLAEVIVEFTGGQAYFTVREIGTSTSRIDSGNVDGLLENNLLLVNKNNTLDRSYFPQDMIYSRPSRGRAAVDVRLQKEAMEQLNYMLDAAYNDGVSGMVITSAFRTFDKQTSLFNNKTSVLSRKMNRKAAMEEASKVVAVPGSSEHQTGLAADICSEGVGLISNFSNTKQGKWLKDNSWRFGYIIRYPEEKTEITGIIYEPWHVRYVGTVHSEIMETGGMCLEEYVDYLKENNVISFIDSSGSNYMIQYIHKPDFNASGLTLNLPETSDWSISNCTKDSYILTVKL